MYTPIYVSLSLSIYVCVYIYIYKYVYIYHIMNIGPHRRHPAGGRVLRVHHRLGGVPPRQPGVRRALRRGHLRAAQHAERGGPQQHQLRPRHRDVRLRSPTPLPRRQSATRGPGVDLAFPSGAASAVFFSRGGVSVRSAGVRTKGRQEAHTPQYTDFKVLWSSRGEAPDSRGK